MTNSPRVAVITGGSKGIGLLTAHSLAQDGWNVAICSRGASDAELAARDISIEHQIEAIGLCADVADLESMKSFAAAVSKRWGRVDLLLCNAAVLGPIGSVADIADREITSTLMVNIAGVTNSVSAFWSLLVEATEFRIVALAGGGLGGPGQMTRAPAYVPSKAAVASLVEIISNDVFEAGGTINAISPGNIPTAFMQPVLAAGETAAGESLFAQARAREGKDVGKSLDDFLTLLRFITSSESRMINGRFLSARWNNPEQLSEVVRSQIPDGLFRLRRIDNDLYMEHE